MLLFVYTITRKSFVILTWANQIAEISHVVVKW